MYFYTPAKPWAVQVEDMKLSRLQWQLTELPKLIERQKQKIIVAQEAVMREALFGYVF